MLGRVALILPFLAAAPGAAAAAEQSAAQASAGQVKEIRHLAELVTAGVEVVGVTVIVLTLLVATTLFLRDGFRHGGWADAYEGYRANLGRGILLGLELLVAADIIGTVAAPLDIRTIGTLGLIVLIRTFLSFSLEVEIKGHWPWQESRLHRQAGKRPDAHPS